MTQPPQPLFDTATRAQRLARRVLDALFLHHEARADIEERLLAVNKTFTQPAIVTDCPQVWGDLRPDAPCVPPTDRLALAEGAHDLILHAMALHWANDPVGQLIQCRRALRPDGLLIAAFLGGDSLTELRSALTQAESRLRGGLSPRLSPMIEIRDAGALLQRAGLALPVADSARLTATYDNALHLMRDLRQMGEGNALTAREKRIPPRDLFAATDRIYIDEHARSDGRIPATFEIVYLTGWAPDASQPQPLRPGSAKTSLAAALGDLTQPPHGAKE